jgi:predicted nucleic acid-binding protein
MVKDRIYVDTSIFGDYYDKEFEKWTRKLFGEFEKGYYAVVISDITLRELEDAPSKVKELEGKLPKEMKEYVTFDDESDLLSKAYIEEGVVPERFLLDSQHIAIATIKRVDVLVSWNFKHIVNLSKIHLYNGVNLKKGYPILEIRSPLEVVYEGD